MDSFKESLAAHIEKMEASGTKKIEYGGQQYYLIGVGTKCDGKVYVHLSSMTEGRVQKNGFRPNSLVDWVDQEKLSDDPEIHPTLF